MTLQVITAGYCSLTGAGTLLHTYANDIRLEVEADTEDVTTHLSTAWKENAVTLLGGNLIIGGFNDYTDNLLDEVMWAHLIARASVAFEVRPTQSAVGTANPKYTGSILVTSWTPIGGKVGEVAKMSVTYPVTGVITRATA